MLGPMKVLVALGFLVVAASSQAIDSKTWMHKGCKIHVTIGAREESNIGSYLVTVVAPSGKRATARMDRDGTITGAWAADLDRDGKFEVLVATRSAGGGSYGKLSIHSWTGSNLKKRSVPELSASQLKGYRGQDTFTVSRNALYRSYPTFTQKSNDPARRTGMKSLRLNLPRFRWEAA